MDDRLYPQGKGGFKSRYNSAGQLVFYDASGNEIFRMDTTVTGGYIQPGAVRNIRTRFTVAAINAGATLLAALVGFKYRMVRCTAIAIGGAAGSVTTVDVLGTQTTSKKLVAFAQAGLTRSAVLKDGDASSAVLADGVSYLANDANTAITVGKTGASVDTATHIDINLSYVVEP